MKQEFQFNSARERKERNFNSTNPRKIHVGGEADNFIPLIKLLFKYLYHILTILVHRKLKRAGEILPLCRNIY